MGVESAKGCPGREGTPGAGGPSPPAGSPQPSRSCHCQGLGIFRAALDCSDHFCPWSAWDRREWGGNGHKFPFLLCFGLEMPFKSQGKNLELAMASYGAQGPHTGTRTGMVQPSQLCPHPVSVFPGPPQGQPGTLDVPQELFQVCGVAPVVEVQEGCGAPWPSLPLPGTAVPPAGGRGPASTGHVTGGDRAAIYTLLCQGWVCGHQ